MGVPEGQELAEVFAQIARDLQAGTTPEHTAASDDVAAMADTIQYEVGQGPCLEAIRDHESYLIRDLMAEQRWPPFSRRAAEETSVRSMLSFRLFVGEDTLGALNLYSREVDAFGQDARAVGAILAAHAAVAMSTARDRERAQHLERAVESNREIGMAMGVVMASGLQTPEEAFAVLRRASQRLNVKLREVASAVVETGELPEHRNGPTGSRR